MQILWQAHYLTDDSDHRRLNTQRDQSAGGSNRATGTADAIGSVCLVAEPYQGVAVIQLPGQSDHRLTQPAAHYRPSNR